MSLGLLVSPSALASCSLDDLDRRLDASFAAFADWTLEPTSFESSYAQGERCLAELDGPVSPRLAARVHLTEALRGQLRSDTDAVIASCRAAFAADPQLTLPAAFGPSSDGLHALCRGEADVTDELTLVFVQDGVELWLDGVGPQRVRPVERPVIAQTKVCGEWQAPQWLLPDAPLPLPTELSCARPEWSPSRRRTSIAFAGAALGTGLAWGGYAWTSTQLHQARDLELSQEGAVLEAGIQLDRLATSRDALTYAGLLGAGVTAGLGTAVLLTWAL